MTEPITIGVDHGYAAMKTAHCSFPSGLAEYEHEPYTQKNVLCYDGKYYVVGSGRQPLQFQSTCPVWGRTLVEQFFFQST